MKPPPPKAHRRYHELRINLPHIKFACIFLDAKAIMKFLYFPQHAKVSLNFAA